MDGRPFWLAYRQDCVHSFSKSLPLWNRSLPQLNTTMALTLKNKDSDNPETPPNPPSISDLPEPVFPEDRTKLLAPTCFQCGKKISGAHFAMGSDKVCPECKAAIEQAFNQGSKSKRFLKAGILGAVAALIGATVYFLVTWKTGYQYAIIAIGIGWLVGAAVRHGSERRGGAPYQALAVLLTYLALALPNIPLAVMTWDDEGYLDEAQSTAYNEEEGFIEDESPVPGQGEETFTVVASEAVTADETPADVAEDAEPFNAGAGTVVLGIAVLIGIALISPFFMGFLGILIVLFGLFEAWRLNKGVKLEFEPVDSV